MRGFIALWFVLGALILIGCEQTSALPGPESTQRGRSVLEEQLAFSGYPDGYNYLINADGTGLVRRTNDEILGYSHVWSPDGSMLAYISKVRWYLELRVMDADGANNHIAALNFEYSSVPSWSPTSNKIAFPVYTALIAPTRDFDLFTVCPDSSELLNLTQSAERNEFIPMWSPGGSQFAFWDEGIYIMNADGTGAVKLISFGDNPVWSSDVSWLVITDYDGEAEIYVMAANGSGLKKLTDNTANDHAPVWSPDGASLASQSNRNGSYAIFTMQIDGSNTTQLTFGSINEYGPEWSPDGARIAFWTNQRELFTMNADGSNLTKPADGVQPRWRPAALTLRGNRTAHKHGWEPRACEEHREFIPSPAERCSS